MVPGCGEADQLARLFSAARAPTPAPATQFVDTVTHKPPTCNFRPLSLRDGVSHVAADRALAELAAIATSPSLNALIMRIISKVTAWPFFGRSGADS